MDNKVWALGRSEDLSVIKKEIIELNEKYESLKKKNFKLKNVKGAFYFMIICIVLGILASIIFFNPGWFFFGLFIGGVVYYFVWMPYSCQLRDLTKYMVAKRFGWYYKPSQDRERWKKLKELIPEIFKIKNYSGFCIDDQFFGSTKNKNQTLKFHSGSLYFTDKINQRAKESLSFFALKLEKKVGVRLLLYPERGMLNYLVEKKKVFKRDLNVESVDFNRKFAFSYNGKKVEKQADIFKVISPSMQIKLLDLYQKKGPFKVLFAEDYVVFLFLGDFLKKPRMEYARKFEISESDIEKIESDFNGLIELAVPIAQRLH